MDKKDFIKTMRSWQNGSITRRDFLGRTGLGLAAAVVATNMPGLLTSKAYGADKAIGDALFSLPLDAVFRLVGEQPLDRRQRGRRRSRLAFLLVVRNAEAVVERAQPGARGDRLEPRQPFWRHLLAALVARGDEGKVVVELR